MMSSEQSAMNFTMVYASFDAKNIPVTCCLGGAQWHLGIFKNGKNCRKIPML